MLSGVIISLIFGFLTQSLLTNHVATGLALTIFGIGLSAMLGKNFVGIPGKEFPILFSSLRESIPFFGPILFGHSIVLYFAFTPDFCPILLDGDPWIVQPSEYYDEIDINGLKKKHS